MESVDAISSVRPELSGHARYAVVLTACIDPTRALGQVPVCRADPAVRLTDYMQALRFWLTHCDERITKLIFLDNSGYPLEQLQKIAKDENHWHRDCVFVSLDCNEHRHGVNYGYSEFKLLDLGLRQEGILDGVEYLAKVTGRYRFPEISQLLDKLPHPYLIAADTRDNGFLRRYRQRIVAAPLILFSVPFFNRHIRSLYSCMTSYAEDPRRSFIEDVLYDTLIPMRKIPGVILRWPCNCDPVGIGGNGNDLSNRKRRLVASARAIGRRLFPNWWF